MQAGDWARTRAEGASHLPASSRLPAELPGSPVFFYPALGVVAPAPLYMARADCGAYPGGGTATPPPANHTAPGGGSPHSIDALKSRVLESAPGEVKQIIAASRLPLRCARRPAAAAVGWVTA